MTWWQMLLQYVAPAVVSGAGAWVVRGRIAARTAAANTATDTAADAVLKKLREPEDEDTRH